MSDIVLMEALAAGAYAAMRTLSYHESRKHQATQPATSFVVTGTKPKTTQPGSGRANVAPKLITGTKPKTTQPGPKPKPKTTQPGPSKPKPGSANYVAGFSKLSKAQQAELRAAQAKIDALKRAAAKGR
jgi:hypothetical protein